MREISVDHFVRYFNEVLDTQEINFAFFLGAGCSMPEIPGAADLVKHWLPRLYNLETGGGNSFDQWMQNTLENYDPDNQAVS